MFSRISSRLTPFTPLTPFTRNIIIPPTKIVRIRVNNLCLRVNRDDIKQVEKDYIDELKEDKRKYLRDVDNTWIGYFNLGAGMFMLMANNIISLFSIPFGIVILTDAYKSQRKIREIEKEISELSTMPMVTFLEKIRDKHHLVSTLIHSDII